MMMFLPTAIFDFYSTHVWQDIKDYSFPHHRMGGEPREVEGLGLGCDREVELSRNWSLRRFSPLGSSLPQRFDTPSRQGEGSCPPITWPGTNPLAVRGRGRGALDGGRGRSAGGIMVTVPYVDLNFRLFSSWFQLLAWVTFLICWAWWGTG